MKSKELEPTQPSTVYCKKNKKVTTRYTTLFTFLSLYFILLTENSQHNDIARPMAIASVGIATFFKSTNVKVHKNEIEVAIHEKMEIKSKLRTCYCQINKQVACSQKGLVILTEVACSQTGLVILTEVACSQTRLIILTEVACSQTGLVTYIALFYGWELSYSLHTSQKYLLKRNRRRR